MAVWRWAGGADPLKNPLRVWLPCRQFARLVAIVFATLAFQSTDLAYAVTAADCNKNGGSVYCTKAPAVYINQVGPGIFTDADEACRAVMPKTVTDVHWRSGYSTAGGSWGDVCDSKNPNGSDYFTQNWILSQQTCAVLPGAIQVGGWIDAADMSVTQLGRRWCAYIPPATVQLSVTPSQTKALPAGPAVTGTAIVKNGSAPAAGKGISIALSGGGTLGGITDANGKFVFKFIPPGNQTTATLTANCTECLYAVQAAVSVDPASASCSAAEFASDAGSLVGNPISPATGSKVQVDNDFTDNAPHGLSLTRQYRSTAGLAAAGFASGNTWSHNYAASLTLSPDGTQATVLLGDGNSFGFTRPDPNNFWVPSTGNPNHRLEEINPLQYNTMRVRRCTPVAQTTPATGLP